MPSLCLPVCTSGRLVWAGRGVSPKLKDVVETSNLVKIFLVARVIDSTILGRGVRGQRSEVTGTDRNSEWAAPC